MLSFITFDIAILKLNDSLAKKPFELAECTIKLFFLIKFHICIICDVLTNDPSCRIDKNLIVSVRPLNFFIV
jgi:hypothetical protein